MKERWPSRKATFEKIAKQLDSFSSNERELKGVSNTGARDTLAMQFIASLRRMDFTNILKSRGVDPGRANPLSSMFDPERAAVFHMNNGNVDEAIWLIFLSTHFGKHGRHGWKRLKDFYSGLGTSPWTWERVKNDFESFANWLESNHSSIGGAFGNHRKYETLNPDSAKGTLVVIRSFVDCLIPSPRQWFADLARRTGNDPFKNFDAAYEALTIQRFGRLAKFDFLALLGRLDLAPIRPGSTYLQGATGPLRGARLLVDGDANSSTKFDELESLLNELDGYLNVGMQVMEDAICNWQKSPHSFKHFKG